MIFRQIAFTISFITFISGSIANGQTCHQHSSILPRICSRIQARRAVQAGSCDAFDVRRNWNGSSCTIRQHACSPRLLATEYSDFGQFPRDQDYSVSTPQCYCQSENYNFDQNYSISTPQDFVQTGQCYILNMSSQPRSVYVPVQRFRSETRTRQVPVTRMREERRFDSATNTYKMVQVPYTEMRTQNYTVQVPYTDSTTQSFPIDPMGSSVSNIDVLPKPYMGGRIKLDIGTDMAAIRGVIVEKATAAILSVDSSADVKVDGMTISNLVVLRVRVNNRSCKFTFFEINRSNGSYKFLSTDISLGEIKVGAFSNAIQSYLRQPIASSKKKKATSLVELWHSNDGKNCACKCGRAIQQSCQAPQSKRRKNFQYAVVKIILERSDANFREPLRRKCPCPTCSRLEGRRNYRFREPKALPIDNRVSLKARI